jgi:hypothetical protein
MIAALLGVWMAALAGCASNASPQSRTDGSCFIGGCSDEVCSDQPGAISSCLWHDAYACFQTATCARQRSGACGWVPTPELGACLASHDALPGSQH